jgi:hypothetical protein
MDSPAYIAKTFFPKKCPIKVLRRHDDTPVRNVARDRQHDRCRVEVNISSVTYAKVAVLHQCRNYGS